MTCTALALLCFHPWQPSTVALEAISQAFIAADAVQTAQLTREGFTEIESDCVIGHHPKPANTYLYFGALMAGHVLVTNLLTKIPGPWATIFQSFTIGWEGQTVVGNIRAGVRF